MKKLLIAMIAVAAMASCSKDYDALGYEDADIITNQGTSEATVGGLTLPPGERVIVPHNGSYTVICSEGCKVNINGSIYYESGYYVNDLKRKHQFD